MRKVKFIAEIGLNHNGSLELAKQLIDVASASGADIAKFQKRTIDILATQETLDAEDNRFPEFGKTYREIREFIEFSRDEYLELKAYCEESKIEFMCTAFDIPAVDFLEDIGVSMYKLASHSLTDIPLLSYVASLGKQTLLSAGMGSLDEVDRAVDLFRSKGCPLILNHCVSAYPTPLEQCNLAQILSLRERYPDLHVGYSGHEKDDVVSLAAVAMGADYIERHITLDNDMIGFDHKISLNPEDLKALIKQIRKVEVAWGDPNKQISETEMITRKKYRRSIVTAREIKSGDLFQADDFIMKNPGTGMEPRLLQSIIGKRASRDLVEDHMLTVDDVQ